VGHVQADRRADLPAGARQVLDSGGAPRGQPAGCRPRQVSRQCQRISCSAQQVDSHTVYMFCGKLGALCWQQAIVFCVVTDSVGSMVSEACASHAQWHDRVQAGAGAASIRCTRWHAVLHQGPLPTVLRVRHPARQPADDGEPNLNACHNPSKVSFEKVCQAGSTCKVLERR
jgi:hypothetical protein